MPTAADSEGKAGDASWRAGLGAEPPGWQERRSVPCGQRMRKEGNAVGIQVVQMCRDGVGRAVRKDQDVKSFLLASSS